MEGSHSESITASPLATSPTRAPYKCLANIHIVRIPNNTGRLLTWLPEPLTRIDWKTMMENDLLKFRNSLQVNFHPIGSQCQQQKAASTNRSSNSILNNVIATDARPHFWWAVLSLRHDRFAGSRVWARYWTNPLTIHISIVRMVKGWLAGKGFHKLEPGERRGNTWQMTHAL